MKLEVLWIDWQQLYYRKIHIVHISHQKHFLRYCIYCVVIICHCYYCSEVSCREGPGVLKIYLDSKVFLYHTKCSIPKPKTSMGACKQLKIRKMKRLLCFSRLTPRLICSDNDRQGHLWRQLKLLLLLPLLKIKSNGLVIWNFFYNTALGNIQPDLIVFQTF